MIYFCDKNLKIVTLAVPMIPLQLFDESVITRELGEGGRRDREFAINDSFCYRRFNGSTNQMRSNKSTQFSCKAITEIVV